MQARRYPDGFPRRAAAAAHQVEGGNAKSDVWVLEHLLHTKRVIR
jgi:hypothetical protein